MTVHETWAESELELIQLLAWMWNDTPASSCDAIYAYGHTPNNDGPPVRKATELYRTFTCPVLLCGGGSYYLPGKNVCAYSGGEAWKRELVQLGVRESDIVLLPRPELSHTGTESRALLGYAIQHDISTLAIVFIPGHFRAFVDVVSHLIRRKLDRTIQVYSCPTAPLPWNQVARWSQGDMWATRLDSLEGELSKLKKYRGTTTLFPEGDLVSPSEVLSYLMERDTT